MSGFGISQAIFQPGVFAEHSPRPRAEDEPLMHVRGRTYVMSVTRLMASILLHLTVRCQHPRPRTPSGGLHPAATGKARWVQEGEDGTYWGLGVVG